MKWSSGFLWEEWNDTILTDDGQVMAKAPMISCVKFAKIDVLLIFKKNHRELFAESQTYWIHIINHLYNSKSVSILTGNISDSVDPIYIRKGTMF